jgi:aromatic-L-amino-acid decarboxylase
MILRMYGARTIREHLARHIDLARQLAGWIDEHPDFERLAPVPLSVVCFRWRPAAEPGLSDAELDAANHQLVDRVNAAGEIFLSHTRINGRVAIRIAIGHISTELEDVRAAWNALLKLRTEK